MTGSMIPDLGRPYIHYKGGRYIPLHVAQNSEQRDQWLVVYVSATYLTLWVRPLETPGVDSWNDAVDWPDGSRRARFMPLSYFLPLEINRIDDILRGQKAKQANAGQDSQ